MMDWWNVRGQRNHTVPHGYLFVPVPSDATASRGSLCAPVVFVEFRKLIRPGGLPYAWVTPPAFEARVAKLVPSRTRSGSWDLQIPAGGTVAGEQRRVCLTRRYGGVAAIST